MSSVCLVSSTLDAPGLTTTATLPHAFCWSEQEMLQSWLMKWSDITSRSVQLVNNQLFPIRITLSCLQMLPPHVVSLTSLASRLWCCFCLLFPQREQDTAASLLHPTRSCHLVSSVTRQHTASNNPGSPPAPVHPCPNVSPLMQAAGTRAEVNSTPVTSRVSRAASTRSFTCLYSPQSLTLSLSCSSCCVVGAANVLSRQLQGWLDDANKVSNETQQPVKAIIAP